MESGQQEYVVNEHCRSDTVVLVPSADHQNLSSTSCEHFWKQSPTDSAFLVDFPTMEFNEMSLLCEVENRSTEESLAFLRSRSSGEDTSFNARSTETKSDEVLAGSQEVDLKLNRSNSHTAVQAKDSSSLLKISVSAQDLTTSQETSALMYEDFPTLQKNLVSKNHESNAEHQLTNTLRENAQKILCNNSRDGSSQNGLNNLTSKDVESTSKKLEHKVLNGLTETVVSRTWANVVNTQSNTMDNTLRLPQEVQESKVTHTDVTFEQKNPYSGTLPTAQEIAQTAKRTRLLLDSVWQNFQDAKQRMLVRIVDHLKQDLKTLYTQNMSQNISQNMGFGSLSTFNFLPLSTAFNISVLSRNGTLRKITADKELFPKYYKTNLKNVVLFGKPNYGKTTFCSCLAFNWTVSRDFVLKYTLCVSVHVSQLKITTNVSDALIEFLCVISKNSRAYNKEETRSALLSIEDSILFVIDGYDELFADDERKMMRFLFDRTEFRKSTVLITARPIVNEAFGKRFEHVLHLGGFSFNHLLSLLKACTVSPIRITNFKDRFDKDDRLLYLTELPPVFLNCVCKLVANFHCFHEANSCVLPLLVGVTNLQEQEWLHSSGDNDSILIKLGKLMFEALVTGYSSFTEQLLKKVFSDKLDLLKKCGVFYKEREWQSKMWTVSSKVLMVFYATSYLRRYWSKLKDANERQLFLDNVFCFGDSIGNYVTAQDDSPRISCYVGVIPEIVLSFEGDGLLENAKFKMYHDVEAVEFSHAFHSTTLLVRIGKRHITRFGFQELEVDDPKAIETFQDIFEYLGFSDLCVDYEVYYNMYESRSFLNVSVTNDDDNNVLRFVCRADDRRLLDRAHVEFEISVLESVFSFLNHVLSQVLNGIKLDEDLILKEPHELVWSLFHSIVKSDSPRSVTLVCYDYSTAPTKGVLKNFTFSVYKCPKAKSTTVEILSTLHNEERVSNYRVYKSKEMLAENEMVLRLLKNWLNTVERPGISISIF